MEYAYFGTHQNISDLFAIFDIGILHIGVLLSVVTALSRPSPRQVVVRPPSCHPERAAKDLAQKGPDAEGRCVRSFGCASG